MQETEQTSTLSRVGEASLMALGGAFLCALPTALRARAAGGGLFDGLLTGIAVMLCVLGPLAWLLPKAARGWRGVVGQSTPQKVIVGLGLWVVLTAATLTLLGTFLQARTNHRGLGGATFGVFSAFAALAIAVFVVRAVTVAEPLEAHPRWRWPVRVGGALLVLGVLAFIGLPLLRAGGPSAALARASIFDVVVAALVVAVLLPRRAPSAALAVSRVAALPVAACLVVIGFVRIETSNSAMVVKAGGGMVATLLGALEHWTDQDGDGVGSHFGGRDCDEGDPAKHPLADDIPGDGIDTNCDGHDEAPPSAVAVAPPEPAEVTSAATVVASAPPAPTHPDIIVVTLDTVRADHTTVYGYAKPTTPNLAALAKRGVVFEHAYAAGSDTQRALTPVISGTTISSTPHTNVDWPRLRDEVDTVAERLHQSGYATGGISSFTWARKDRGFAQGFDEFDQSAWKDRHPEREPTGALAIDAAIALYRKLAGGDAPLYLWVHLFDAHDKYVEHAGHDFGKSPSDLYDGELAYLDAEFARLVAAVDGGPRRDRTAWLVHGSHGEAFGEHGQSGHGTQLYEESIRVPMFAVTPGTQASRFDKSAVSVLDIAPTVLDLAGASATGTKGVSLRPVLENRPFDRRPVLAYANRRVTLIDWPFKLHVFRRPERRDRLLLFNLVDDPEEKKDRAADEKDALVRLDALRTKAESTDGNDD